MISTDSENYDQQPTDVEVLVEPTEVTLARGEEGILTCIVKGAHNYKVTWGKYGHDTNLPNYAKQQDHNVIINPNNNTSDEQLYFQCQLDVPGHVQPYHACASVNIRGGDESSKKKRKRRS